MTFRISIGDVVMCKWSGEEENWESKTNDPSEFPYAENTASTLAESSRSRKSKQSDAGLQYPDVVTKRLCIPFEFRFTNQEVSVIKDLFFMSG